MRAPAGTSMSPLVASGCVAESAVKADSKRASVSVEGGPDAPARRVLCAPPPHPRARAALLPPGEPPSDPRRARPAAVGKVPLIGPHPRADEENVFFFPRRKARRVVAEP